MAAEVEELSRLIEQIAAEMTRSAPSALPAILAAHRAAVYRAMDDLAAGIASFLAAAPSEQEIAATHDALFASLRGWATTGPLFASLLRWRRDPSNYHEVEEWLQAARPGGADAAALVSNDYILHTVAACAYRNRLAMMASRLRGEVTRRAGANARPVRVWYCCGTGIELTQASQDRTFAKSVHITCAGSSASVRAARRNLNGSFPLPPALLRATPPHFAMHVTPREKYDVVYTGALLDTLDDEQAAATLAECHDLLAPGGVLLIGGMSSEKVPVGERILSTWLMGLSVFYRGETELRRILAQTPFAGSTLRCEYEPLVAGLETSIDQPAL